MRQGILTKLYAGYVVLILVTAGIIGLLVSTRVERAAMLDVDRQLETAVRLLDVLADDALRDAPPERLQERLERLGKKLETRLTVVRADGVVLAETDHDPSSMNNHGRREEVLQALAEGRGTATRYSATMGRRMRYLALPWTREGETLGVVRASLPLTDVDERREQVRSAVFLGITVAAAVALLLGYLPARHFTRPLREMADLAHSIASTGAFGQCVPVRSRDEIGRLAIAFNTMSENLRRLEVVRRDFIGNVSHEIKTPVTAIRGMVETLVDDPDAPPEVLRRFHLRMHAQSERLAILVDDLLALSRLEAEERPLELEPIELGEVLAACVDVHRPSAEAGNIELICSCAGEGVTVLAEEEGIRQAVGNLLSNAIKYSPSGGRVELRTRREAKWIAVEVCDNGPGIEPRHHQRLFERFYRVDAARSRELGGTGLGLAIVKHTMLAFGGDVGVESLPGEGSTFSLRFPVASSSPSSETGTVCA